VNKIVVYIFIYAVGILSLLLFYYIHSSTGVAVFLKKADNYGTDTGFFFYAIIGLLKLFTLVFGIITPIILTALLIKNRKN
jgi:hypothetical protein